MREPRFGPRRDGGCEGDDINVGLPGAWPWQRRGAKPASGLARRVLSPSSNLLTILALTMLFQPGCILPVSPRFEDPPAPGNYPPEIDTTAPAQGTIWTVQPGEVAHFSVTVSDPNNDDNLFVRWI